MNSVEKSLKAFCKAVRGCDNYFILGSVALLSYTRPHYTRPIKDIDTIVDSMCIEHVENMLLHAGYKKSTFVDRSTPLSFFLAPFSQKKYLRFYKKGAADIEILVTPFVYTDSYVEIELFPCVHAQILQSEIKTSQIYSVSFKTVSPGTLRSIKQFTNSTVGKIYRKNKEKREADISALSSFPHLYLRITFCKITLYSV